VLFYQKHNAGKINKSLEAGDKLVITGGNTSEMFEFVEKALN
jgi:peptidase E